MTDLSDIALEFSKRCLGWDDAQKYSGSHLVYSRKGRFNPYDLSEVMQAMTMWCMDNKKHFSLSCNPESNAKWVVIVSGDVSSHAISPFEALMDAGIEAHKALGVPA